MLTTALRNIGLSVGDTVLLQSDLLRLGPVQNDMKRDELLSFYLSAFQSVLGEMGTICVLTSFEDYARASIPFDRRFSPSQSGILSQYILDQRGSIRSTHPIVSITALGHRAEEICGGNHFEGFGWDSPWGRLHMMNAKLLSLGYGVAPDGMTFLHYLERLFGVPYQYTKIFDTSVTDDGNPINGIFTLSVRYLDFKVDYDQRSLKQNLLDRGLAAQVPLGRGVIYSTTCNAAELVAKDMFRDDRYMMLKHPPKFHKGTIPFDGLVD